MFPAIKLFFTDPATFAATVAGATNWIRGVIAVVGAGLASGTIALPGKLGQYGWVAGWLALGGSQFISKGAPALTPHQISTAVKEVNATGGLVAIPPAAPVAVPPVSDVVAALAQMTPAERAQIHAAAAPKP